MPALTKWGGEVYERAIAAVPTWRHRRDERRLHPGYYIGVECPAYGPMIVERVNSGLARAKAKGVKLGRGNKKDGERSVDEERWGMSRAELEKRIRSRGAGLDVAHYCRLLRMTRYGPFAESAKQISGWLPHTAAGAYRAAEGEHCWCCRKGDKSP